MAGRVRRHNLDQSRGRAAMFSGGGEVPWHGLGKVIAGTATAAEALTLAELDWTVEQWPLEAYKPGEGATDRVKVGIRFANVRSDTKGVLGVVSPQYLPLQNAAAFEFMELVLQDGSAKWETAGAIDGGKRVWMLARMPGTVEVVPGDEVLPYALICNGHDGSLAVHIMPTTVRVVCNNTLNLALNNATGSKKELVIRHSQQLTKQVNEARKQLGIVARRVESFKAEAQAMAGQELGSKAVKDYFTSMFPTQVKPALLPLATDGAALLDSIVAGQADRKAIVAELLEGHYAETEVTAKRNAAILEQLIANYDDLTNTLPGMRHTAWAAYNAVSEYADHQKNHRTADARLNSAWFGAGDALKQEAYTSALALVGR